MHMHSGHQAVSVVHLQGLKDSQTALRLYSCVTYHKGVHLHLFPPVLQQVSLQFPVPGSVCEPPCRAAHSLLYSPPLNKVDSLLPPEGFLTGALVIHIGMSCSWDHHEVRFVCLLKGSTHLGRQQIPVVLD